MVGGRGRMFSLAWVLVGRVRARLVEREDVLCHPRRPLRREAFLILALFEELGLVDRMLLEIHNPIPYREMALSRTITIGTTMEPRYLRLSDLVHRSHNL